MNNILSGETSRRNFASFLWHASFLALAQSFLDIDTIVPAMIVEAGGTAIHVGIMAAILTGGSSFTQILFAPYISNKPYKKKFLLLGINSRMFSLLGLGLILFYLSEKSQGSILPLIFLFITIFAIGGAFANISYTDLVGKSLLQEKRKSFFSSKQMVTSIILIASAFWAKSVITGREFPQNYGNAIIIGFIALSLASLGFWNLKETVPASLPIKSLKSFLNTMKEELKANPRLAYFLGFVNTQGLVIGFLPFLILYAKELTNMGSSGTGTLLIFKITGSVFISLMIFFLSRRAKYGNMLYFNSGLALTLPVIMLILGDKAPMPVLFLLGGMVFALYSITMNGVLLEISGNHNRAIYAGFAGAGNIIPAIFPLAVGWMIRSFGFNTFFIVYIAFVSLSFFFIYRLKCTK
jgi:MFS family permease